MMIIMRHHPRCLRLINKSLQQSSPASRRARWFSNCPRHRHEKDEIVHDPKELLPGPPHKPHARSYTILSDSTSAIVGSPSFGQDYQVYMLLQLSLLTQTEISYCQFTIPTPIYTSGQNPTCCLPHNALAFKTTEQ